LFSVANIVLESSKQQNLSHAERNRLDSKLPEEVIVLRLIVPTASGGIDLLDGILTDEGQFIRTQSDNGPVFLMKVMDGFASICGELLVFYPETRESCVPWPGDFG